ncbi:MAG: hypothetical protein AB1724_08370 [Thermodesulfobacteriota bacterium]
MRPKKTERKRLLKSAGYYVLTAALLITLSACDWDDSDSDKRTMRAAPNPFLSSSLYGITHFDSSQSDSTPYGPPAGTFTVDPEQQPISWGGPVNIITLAAVDPDYMWGVGTDHVAYVRMDDERWNTVAFLDAPAYMDPTLGPVSEETQRDFGQMDPAGMTIDEMDVYLVENFGTNYLFRLFNGAYSVVDRDNVLYANFGFGIYAFGLRDFRDPSRGIEVLRQIDNAADIQEAAGFMPPDSIRLFGLTLTYDGYLIVNFNNGIAVIDRDFDLSTARFYPFGLDESTTNSIAVDEDNGIYVASNKIMRKLVWTGDRISDLEADGAWSSPYDAPEDAVPPIVKFGTGTGSTPTLMGFGSDSDKLVVITDGSRRMKLVAFWRDAIPADFVQRPDTASRRIAGQMEVTCGFAAAPDWIQSEQSVVVDGYGAFVVNNIPENAEDSEIAGTNKLLAVSLMGPAYDTCYGVERFRWDTDEDRWVSVWSRPDVSSTSMIPVHSRSQHLAVVNGYTPERGWEVTGLDWDSGATVHQTIFGRQNFGNGAYAILQYLKNGDLVFNSIVGPFRVSYVN